MISLRFDVTDGRVTYRTIREFEVTGLPTATQTLKAQFDDLRGTNTTSFTSEVDFKELPRLLKNLKKITINKPEQEQALRTRILNDNFLDDGSCTSSSDPLVCGGTTPFQGSCKRINETDPENMRMKCQCETDYLGDFCQLKNSVAPTFATPVSDILVKVGNYLNQTERRRPNVTSYAQFLMYREVLWNSIDFLDDKSVLAFSFILHRVQPIAQSPKDIEDITILYKRTYNYYWNRYTEF